MYSVSFGALLVSLKCGNKGWGGKVTQGDFDNLLKAMEQFSFPVETPGRQG